MLTAVFLLDDHPLDRQRNVVVFRPLAIARACHGIKTDVVRPALGVGARWQDADGLPLQNRKGLLAEIENNMMDVAFRVGIGDAVVARDPGHRRIFAAIDARIGMRGGKGRRHAPALPGGRRFDDARDLLRFLLRLGNGGGLGLFGQLFPRVLILKRPGLVHQQPVVYRARRTGGNARPATIAYLEINDIVVVVVGDGVDGAGFLAGIAANADSRVDQVLAAQFHG